MTPLVVVLLLLTAALAAALAVVVLRRPAPDAAAQAAHAAAQASAQASAQLLQQQLVGMQRQLAELTSGQQAMHQTIPAALATGRAEQAEALAERLEGLAAVLAQQLEVASQSTGQRLDVANQVAADMRQRLGQLAELATRLEAVGSSVGEVQALLRTPKLRGTLGEVWLEELLRQVFPASHFQMQYAFPGNQVVDAIVRIGPYLVPIDAKFPLEACQRMLAAEGEARTREQREFRRSIRARIDEIADKYIRPEAGTSDFALMYIPAEAVYYEAVVRGEVLEDGASLLGYAMTRRVIPVSPHTMYAYLSAILHGLKGLQVEARAREILSELGGLEQRFGRFWVAFEKVGRHLGNASTQYGESARLAEKVQTQFGAILQGASGAHAALPDAADLEAAGALPARTTSPADLAALAEAASVAVAGSAEAATLA